MTPSTVQQVEFQVWSASMTMYVGERTCWSRYWKYVFLSKEYISVGASQSSFLSTEPDVASETMLTWRNRSSGVWRDAPVRVNNENKISRHYKNNFFLRIWEQQIFYASQLKFVMVRFFLPPQPTSDRDSSLQVTETRLFSCRKRFGSHSKHSIYI